MSTAVLSSAARFLRRAISAATPRDTFAESRRIQERFKQEAGGSFLIVYRALSEESRAAGWGALLSEDAVVARIRSIRQG